MKTLKYEYQIQKIAVIKTPKGPVQIGVFKKAEREGDLVKMELELRADLPEDMMIIIKEMPHLIDVGEQKMPAENVMFI